MRILVAQFFHESNSFAPHPTREAEFRSECLLTGEAMFDRWRGTNSEIAGFLDAADGLNRDELTATLIPIISAWAWPAGPVADDVFTRVKTELAQALAKQTFDGILLSLHGAGITQSHADAEGELLAFLRSRIVPKIPIVATLDFHANVSPAMVEHLTAFVGYKTYPHVDYRERGAEAMRLLFRALRGEVKPTVGYTQPPLLFVPQRQWTAYEPMKSVMTRAQEMERDERVLVANIFGGFAYGDTEHAGFSASVVTNDDPELAQRYSDELATLAWNLREDFVPVLKSPQEAVAEATEATDGLTVLVDIGDNIGGGTPGDGTVLLAELIRQKAEGVVVILCDPDAARECARAGVGAEVQLRVGGSSDAWHGKPVAVRGKVRMLFDGEYTNIGPMRDGIRENQGLTARVVCQGLELLLTRRKMPPWNLEQLRAVGIEPTRTRIFVAKSAIAFRAAYEPIARRIIEVDTPGLTSANLSRFPFKRVRRPIFPLDSMEKTGGDHSP